MTSAVVPAHFLYSTGAQKYLSDLGILAPLNRNGEEHRI